MVTALIPIAGLGTRMFPASLAAPKALFPIVDSDLVCRPILHVIVREALSAPEVHNVVIVVSPAQAPSVEAYFSGEAPEYAARPALAPLLAELAALRPRITLAVQPRPEGFGHAVLCGLRAMDPLPAHVLILLGDHIYTAPPGPSPAAQLLAALPRLPVPALTAIDSVPAAALHNNGIVRLGPGSPAPVLSIHEKPSPEEAASLGLALPSGRFPSHFGMELLPAARLMHILETQYSQLRATDPSSELQLRSAMDELARTDGLYALMVQGRRYDTGNPRDYAEAVAARTLPFQPLPEL